MMKKYIGILCLITATLNAAFVAGQVDEEVCLRKTSSGPTPTAIQGPPGKSGSVGSPGLKGSQGSPGQCGCNPSEIEQLSERITDLNDALRQTDEKITFVSRIAITPESAVKWCSVGMRDGRVSDSDITASSIYDYRHAAYHGRLDYKGKRSPFLSSGWAAKRLQSGEWIQVDLLTPTFVTGVVTQGRSDYSQWVTSYKISFGNSTGSLQVMKNKDRTDKIFSGNNDKHTYVIHRFDKPVTARYFRLIALSWYIHLSLRMDYFSC